MLAKHYYQAAGAWVVFFVPRSDADMGLYNEFMNYLGEKQRAAVAKLDEKNTLFLVPPSEFSEMVLKVPGKLSISGVILRLDEPASSVGSVNLSEIRDTNLFHSDAAYARPSTPLGSFHPISSYSEPNKSAVGDISYRGPRATNLMQSASRSHVSGNSLDHYNDGRNDHLLCQQNLTSGSNLSNQEMHSVSLSRSMQSQISRDIADHHVVMSRGLQEARSNTYTGGVSGISNGQLSFEESKTSLPLSNPIRGIQPELLAQLASSLQTQQRLMGNSSNISVAENYHQQANTMDQAELLRRSLSNSYALQNNQLIPDVSTAQAAQQSQQRQQQVQQVQQLVQQQQQQVQQQQQQVQQQQQQVPNMMRAMPSTAQGGTESGIQQNQQPQSSTVQEDADADPQKRLQATLQLAAALLQQIQGGKAT